MSARSKIAKAAGKMSVATLISRILGYIKDMILAGFFGASASADVFFAAFRIPNLLRELFAEGSMSSAFIPVLKEEEARRGDEAAKKVVRSVFLFIIVFVGLICMLGIIFAPAIVSAIAPGFLEDQAKFDTTVLLTRIMFPFLLFISLASLTMGALNTRGVFFIPALAPALLNIVTMISVVGFSSFFTQPIVSVALGVCAGGFVQFLFQVPAFKKEGFSFIGRGFSFKDLSNPALKKIGRLVLPATAGMAVNQINIFVSTILASFLAEGSITYLYYSMRLVQFPVGIFGVAVGMAVLPALSEHAVRGDIKSVKEDFSFALRLLFFLTVPAMAGLIALKTPIVSTLFQRGQFDYAATIGTADALMYYSLGIWAIVGVRVITSTFYSMQDTKTPVKIVAVTTLLNIMLSLLLMGSMKHNGLALANAAASTANFGLLYWLLRKKIGSFGSSQIALSFLKTLCASVVMAAAGWLMLSSGLWVHGSSVIGNWLFLGIGIILCFAIYLTVSYLLKSEEMLYLAGKVSQKIWQGGSR
ncbi:MAG: murein biosynthesis integral membrane protein MurJ [Nitrospirae bacterium]|nr:murein biosynthesis integral membrane protein MurJ [Nitrospirota bacterium]